MFKYEKRVWNKEKMLLFIDLMQVEYMENDLTVKTIKNLSKRTLFGICKNLLIIGDGNRLKKRLRLIQKI